MARGHPSGNHHLPSTRGNKGCLHINILPEQHEDRGEDTGQEHLFCNVQILAGTVLSTWINAPFKGDSSAGIDDEALSAAQTSLAPLEAWAFGGQPLKNTSLPHVTVLPTAYHKLLVALNSISASPPYLTHNFLKKHTMLIILLVLPLMIQMVL